MPIELSGDQGTCQTISSQSELFVPLLRWAVREGNICLQIVILCFLIPRYVLLFLWEPGTWDGIYLDYSKYPLSIIALTM